MAKTKNEIPNEEQPGQATEKKVEKKKLLLQKRVNSIVQELAIAFKGEEITYEQKTLISRTISQLQATEKNLKQLGL